MNVFNENKKSSVARINLEQMIQLQSTDVNFIDPERNNGASPADLEKIHTLFREVEGFTFVKGSLGNAQNKQTNSNKKAAFLSKHVEYTKEGLLYFEIAGIILSMYKADDIKDTRVAVTKVVEGLKGMESFRSIEDSDKASNIREIREFVLNNAGEVEGAINDMPNITKKNLHKAADIKTIELLGAPGVGKSYYLKNELQPKLRQGHELNDSIVFELDDFRVLVDRDGQSQEIIQKRFDALLEGGELNGSTIGALAWESVTQDGMQEIKQSLIRNSTDLLTNQSRFREVFNIKDGEYPVVLWNGASHSKGTQDLMALSSKINPNAANEIIVIAKDQSKREVALLERGCDSGKAEEYARFPGIEGARKKEVVLNKLTEIDSADYQKIVNDTEQRGYQLTLTKINNNNNDFQKVADIEPDPDEKINIDDDNNIVDRRAGGVTPNTKDPIKSLSNNVMQEVLSLGGALGMPAQERSIDLEHVNNNESKSVALDEKCNSLANSNEGILKATAVSLGAKDEVKISIDVNNTKARYKMLFDLVPDLEKNVSFTQKHGFSDIKGKANGLEYFCEGANFRTGSGKLEIKCNNAEAQSILGQCEKSATELTVKHQTQGR